MSQTVIRAASAFLAGIVLERRVRVRCDDDSRSNGDLALQTACRLRSHVVIDNITDSVDFEKSGNLRLVETSSRDAVRVYQPRGLVYSSSNYHKIIRIATTEVNGSMAAVEAKWLHEQGSFIDNAKLVKEEGKESSIYYKIYRSFFVPARDFVYQVERFKGGSIVGANSFNTVVFVSSSLQGALLPRTWTMVRADYSSLLIVEPSGQSDDKCVATYIVEVDPKGWLTTTPFTEIAHMLVGNDVVSGLSKLKRAVEADSRVEREKTNAMLSESVESIVQRKISKDKKSEQEGLVSNVGGIPDRDILLTIQKMEARLHQVERDEQKSKIDMGDLKRRIAKDISALREQYKSRR